MSYSKLNSCLTGILKSFNEEQIGIFKEQPLQRAEFYFDSDVAALTDGFVVRCTFLMSKDFDKFRSLSDAFLETILRPSGGW